MRWKLTSLHGIFWTPSPIPHRTFVVHLRKGMRWQGAVRACYRTMREESFVINGPNVEQCEIRTRYYGLIFVTSASRYGVCLSCRQQRLGLTAWIICFSLITSLRLFMSSIHSPFKQSTDDFTRTHRRK